VIDFPSRFAAASILALVAGSTRTMIISVLVGRGSLGELILVIIHR
jgi:hypothetical protein